MPIARLCTKGLVIVFLVTLVADSAIAQRQEVVETSRVGVRLSIPKDWTWESRRSDIFINCAPEKEDNGRPACYFTIRKASIAADQRTITDADRARWKGWSSARGMRTILSERDFKVGRFPAYEMVLGFQGSRSRRVMILIPGTGTVFDVWFVPVLADSDYEVYSPAVAAALETLVPAGFTSETSSAPVAPEDLVGNTLKIVKPRALPPGGGEPGRAWLLYDAAFRQADAGKVLDLSSAAAATAFDRNLFSMTKAFRPRNVEIMSGAISGDTATLEVRGVALRAGSQTPVVRTGTVTLVKEHGTWKVDRETWNR